MSTPRNILVCKYCYYDRMIQNSSCILTYNRPSYKSRYVLVQWPDNRKLKIGLLPTNISLTWCRLLSSSKRVRFVAMTGWIETARSFLHRNCPSPVLLTLNIPGSKYCWSENMVVIWLSHVRICSSRALSSSKDVSTAAMSQNKIDAA